MPFIVVVIGVVVAIVAFNNSQGDLAKALEADIPGYFKWGIAIAAILGLGYIPGMEKPSRWLMALVAIVVVLTQYQNIIGGFSSFASSSGASAGSGAAEPTAAYVSSGGAGGLPTATQIAGNASGTLTNVASNSTTPAPLTAAQKLAANPLDPGAYVAAASTAFGGF